MEHTSSVEDIVAFAKIKFTDKKLSSLTAYMPEFIAALNAIFVKKLTAIHNDGGNSFVFFNLWEITWDKKDADFLSNMKARVCSPHVIRKITMAFFTKKIFEEDIEDYFNLSLTKSNDFPEFLYELTADCVAKGKAAVPALGSGHNLAVLLRMLFLSILHLSFLNGPVVIPGIGTFERVQQKNNVDNGGGTLLFSPNFSR
jgi:hypothetical protein